MRAALAAAVLLLLTAPLWIALARVAGQGDYTASRILWRSSPAGVDALTLLLGHPAHLVTGRWTVSAYAAFGIDRMEQGVWLGIVPLLLIAATRHSWSRLPEARFWMFAAFFFLLLALGPFLRVGGYDTALPLPQALLRYVPILSNARIPGRALVVVSLAVAVLTAFALAHLQRRRRSLAALATVLLFLETLPAAAPVYLLPPRDAIDAMLRESTMEGGVAELPLGLRDGFGESGQLDHRALVHQIWHGRPLAGGFVARLPSSVKQRYFATPVLKSLVDISTPAHESIRLTETTARDLGSVGITFVIVNRDTFIANRLPQIDLEQAGFVLLETAGPRELYGRADR
jgi:ABC-type glycerol-3-phosphate transport system permease component